MIIFFLSTVLVLISWTQSLLGKLGWGEGACMLFFPLSLSWHLPFVCVCVWYKFEVRNEDVSVFLSWFQLLAQVFISFGQDLSSCFLIFLPFLVVMGQHIWCKKLSWFRCHILYGDIRSSFRIFFFCVALWLIFIKLLLKPLKQSFQGLSVLIHCWLTFPCCDWELRDRILGTLYLITSGETGMLHVLCLAGLICSALIGGFCTAVHL